MGTNYYLKSQPCESCGQCQNPLHIGKSSVGWRFLFRSYTFPLHINCFDDWLLELKNNKKLIYNEYNEKIDLYQLLELIESKRNGKSNANRNRSFFQDEKGYDFCSNEFS